MRIIFAALSFLVMLTGASPAQTVAPWCGEFLPMIGPSWNGAPFRYIHFVPKRCNKIMVNGAIETIPPGVAVVSGGIVADLQNTCVDKVCGRAVKPNMMYRSYVWKDPSDSVLKFNFDVTGHAEDATNGNEVNAGDPTQSFVGLIVTDANRTVCGANEGLCILSWFHQGQTGLSKWMGPAFGNPIADVCQTTLTPVLNASVKILTFGINSTFRQGYDVPNFYTFGTILNTTAGQPTHAAIGIEWGGTPITFSAGSPGYVNMDHYAISNLGPGVAISFQSDGTLPSPIVAGTTYYIKTATNVGQFTIAATSGGADIAISSGGTGKHMINVGMRQASGRATNALANAAAGALGAEEGWIRGTLMVAAPNGGCARVPEGIITTSPHRS